MHKVGFGAKRIGAFLYPYQILEEFLVSMGVILEKLEEFLVKMGEIVEDREAILEGKVVIWAT